MTDPTPAPVTTAVVVLGGGSGTRVGGGVNKVYQPLAGVAVVAWSLRAAAAVPGVVRLVLVVRTEDEVLARRVLAEDLPGVPVDVVHGGATRHESEAAALAHLAPAVHTGDVQIVVIHDGARPLAGSSLFATVIAEARRVGGAIPGIPARAAVHVTAGTAAWLGAAAPDLVRVQTPQAFRADPLLEAFAAAEVHGVHGTDTASTVEQFGDLAVIVVPGSKDNIKVTFAHDLVAAEVLVRLSRPPTGPSSPW